MPVDAEWPAIADYVRSLMSALATLAEEHRPSAMKCSVKGLSWRLLVASLVAPVACGTSVGIDGVDPDVSTSISVTTTTSTSLSPPPVQTDDSQKIILMPLNPTPGSFFVAEYEMDNQRVEFLQLQRWTIDGWSEPLYLVRSDVARCLMRLSLYPLYGIDLLRRDDGVLTADIAVS